jgi:hypothetical protein
MTIYRRTLKRNDTGPALRVQLRSKDTGAPISLGGATAKFLMCGVDGVLKVNASAVIEDAVDGLIRYDWQADDTDTAGEFDGEVEVTFAGPRVETYPQNGYIQIVIDSDLDDA